MRSACRCGCRPIARRRPSAPRCSPPSAPAPCPTWPRPANSSATSRAKRDVSPGDPFAMLNITNYIAGRHVGAACGKTLDKIDPATGDVIARVPDGDERDVESAVSAARAAFPAWSRTPAAERSRLLLAVAERIEQRREDLARAETADTGKPIRLSRNVDIPR